MITGTIQIATLIHNIDMVNNLLLHLLQSVSPRHFNQIAGSGKWSIAQVAEHIRLSNNSIDQALALKGKPVDRNPAERVDELKKMFLDFKTSYQSPDFIVPAQKKYNRDFLLYDLKASMQRIRDRMYEDDLDELINHPAFGDISKFEILHFVLYHTQRHLRQIKMIAANFET